MKRKYEIVYIFDSALEEPEINEHLARFHEILKNPDLPEPITDIAHWGKRTLAYPIKKKEVGYYVVAHFEADTQVLGEFERVIKLDETVLRYLVVINEGLSVHRSDQPDSSDGLDDVDDGDVDMDDRREPDVVADVPAPSIDAAPESEPTAEEGGE